MHLTESTWTEAAAGDATAALLPVGSTEQHGPHAPLGTDALTAAAVADAAAEAYPEDLVVAPTLPVGISEEHRAFAGSLWLSPDTFRATVRETVESLAHHGWERVVLVNGHGGNVAALREVAQRLTRDGVADVAAVTWFDAVDAPDMGHGGPVETSLLLCTHPDLIREGQLAEAGEGASPGWGEWVHHTNLAYDTDEFSENGVVGDPREASAERGEELLAGATEALCAVLDAMAERD
ncbi:MAG: creatininase family protein [Haloarculaceae archaeon]